MGNKCGAKTRAGGRCRAPSMPNGRCRVHGGPSTGPKSIPKRHHRLKHGIYAVYFTAEEDEFAHEIDLGTVDHELRLVRVMLTRAIAAWEASHGEPELDEVIERKLIGEEGSQEDRKLKVRDYPAIIDRLLGRIESLEMKRMALRAELPPDPTSMDADRLTPGTPDEAPPANPIR